MQIAATTARRSGRRRRTRSPSAGVGTVLDWILIVKVFDDVFRSEGVEIIRIR